MPQPMVVPPARSEQHWRVFSLHLLRAWARFALAPREPGAGRIAWQPRLPAVNSIPWIGGAPRFRGTIRALTILTCFIALAIIHTYPLVSNLTTHLAYGLGDQLLTLTTLEWQRQSLLHEPARFFDSFMFYGVDGVSFFTQLWLGGQLFYLPVATFTGNLVLAYNLAYLIGLVLTSWLAYCALRSVLHDELAAFTGGILWSFALSQLGLHKYPGFVMSWGLPLMLWALLSYLGRPRLWKVAVATAALWLVFATHIYTGLMAGTLALLLALNALLSRALPWPLRSRKLAVVLVTILLATLPFLPLPLGYLSVAKQWHEVRPVWLARWYAAEPQDYLTPLPSSSWYAGWLGQRFARTENTHLRVALFPGVAPVALAVVGLGWAVSAPGRRQRLVPVVAGTAALAVLVGLLLSLGPDLLWRDQFTGITLPYTWVYAVFPPIRALRDVSRFVFLLTIGLALLAALGVKAVRTLAGPRRGWSAWSAGIAVAVVALETLHAPLTLYPIAALAPISPVLALLKTLPPDPLVFIPVEAPTDPNWPDTRRMYWAVTSGPHPMVNGNSALYPQTYWEYQRLIDEADPGDVPAVLDILRVSGVRYGIVEWPSISPPMRLPWTCAIAADSQAQVLHVSERATVIDLGQRASDALQVGFGRLDGRLVESTVPADGDLDITILLSAKDRTRPWLQSDPSAAPQRTLTLEWHPAWLPRRDDRPVHRVAGSTGPRAWLTRLPLLGQRLAAPPLGAERRVAFPSFLAAGEQTAQVVRILSPAQPGRYQLAAAVNGQPWAAWTVQVGRDQEVLTLPAAPGGLGARLHPIRVSRDVFAGNQVWLDAVAENTGHTLWDGQVRLGYRWYRSADGAEQELSDLSGRLYLGADTPPGASFRFAGHIRTPTQPGIYRLHVSPLAELIIWFDDMTPPGAEPLTYDITVHPATGLTTCPVPT